MHSREEDGPGKMIFRPDDYSFPPARFRETIEFQAKGTVIYYSLGPDDRRVPIEGSWRTTDRNVITTEFADGRAPSTAWRLIEQPLTLEMAA